MMNYSYWSGWYDDKIKPKRTVVSFMLEIYIRKKIDEEIDRLCHMIDRKVHSISENTIVDMKKMKDEIRFMKDRLDKKEKKNEVNKD